MPHYCAFGCKNPDVVMHVFPNPAKFPERFKAWVSLVGGKLDTLSDLEIYKNKRICDIHFPDEHRNRYKRLNALAVPSLHLPETTVTQQSTTTNDSQPVVAAELAPASSFVTPVIRHSKTTSDSQPVPAELPGPATYGIIHGAAAVVMEHNYSVLSKTRRNSSLVKDVSVRTSQCMQLRPLRTTIKYLQTELRRMRKKGVSFKERLANAEKLCSKVAFQRVTKNMTKPAQLFVHMQQQSRKKPKGRRFSIEEKILSLSLFKKSPKAYRLLYKYFALPSSKAMKRLLSQIKLSPGINPIIFEKIKKTMAQRDTADRLCSLIFDEMSITPQVFYNSQKDKLQGFSSNQKNSFADHVLVFMVKGIKRSFKQPIAYYFTNSLTKLQLK